MHMLGAPTLARGSQAQKQKAGCATSATFIAGRTSDAMSVITRFNRALPASIQAQLLSEYGDIGRKALAELDALLRTAGCKRADCKRAG